MSRNPYLAASRPSSYTRSSRLSKRNDTPTSRGLMLNRSRSSTSLGGGSLSSSLGSSYGLSSSSYVPTSSWQRSSSSTRPSRYVTDNSSISYSSLRPTTSGDYTQTNRADQRKDLASASTNSYSLPKSPSSGNIVYSRSLVDDADDDSTHLQNYQQSKLSQPDSRPTSARRSFDTEENIIERQTTTTNSKQPPTKAEETISSETGSARSVSPQRRLKQGLAKSHSLDISQKQQPPDVTPTTLTTSMSVDRLLIRSELMTERELRRSFKDLVMEIERLRNQLSDVDDRDQKKQQDWIRKERQMQRKISELEEENKQIEDWREEIRRLKDENTSLLRVVNKLSKQP